MEGGFWIPMVASEQGVPDLLGEGAAAQQMLCRFILLMAEATGSRTCQAMAVSSIRSPNAAPDRQPHEEFYL